MAKRPFISQLQSTLRARLGSSTTKPPVSDPDPDTGGDPANESAEAREAAAAGTAQIDEKVAGVIAARAAERASALDDGTVDRAGTDPLQEELLGTDTQPQPATAGELRRSAASALFDQAEASTGTASGGKPFGKEQVSDGGGITTPGAKFDDEGLHGNKDAAHQLEQDTGLSGQKVMERLTSHPDELRRVMAEIDGTTAPAKPADGTGGDTAPAPGSSHLTPGGTVVTTYPDGEKTTESQDCKTTTTTRPDGSRTVVHKNDDGSTTTTTVDKDGKVTETVRAADGTTTTTTTVPGEGEDVDRPDPESSGDRFRFIGEHLRQASQPQGTTSGDIDPVEGDDMAFGTGAVLDGEPPSLKGALLGGGNPADALGGRTGGVPTGREVSPIADPDAIDPVDGGGTGGVMREDDPFDNGPGPLGIPDQDDDTSTDSTEDTTDDDPSPFGLVDTGKLRHSTFLDLLDDDA